MGCSLASGSTKTWTPCTPDPVVQLPWQPELMLPKFPPVGEMFTSHPSSKAHNIRTTKEVSIYDPLLNVKDVSFIAIAAPQLVSCRPVPSGQPRLTLLRARNNPCVQKEKPTLHVWWKVGFSFIILLQLYGCRKTYRGASTRVIVLSSLINTCSEGPAVSLKGSPTVSPTTLALCGSLFLPRTVPVGSRRSTISPSAFTRR